MRDLMAVILFAVTGVYIFVAPVAFFLLVFSMGMSGDQTTDPRIIGWTSLAIVGSPGVLIGTFW